MDKVLDASKKIVHEAGEFIGNKTADAVTNSSDDKIGKQEPVAEIIFPPEKRKGILNKLRRVLEKWNTIKYLNSWMIQLYQNL